MKIKNFTLAELLHTDCDIPNFPETLEQIANLLKLAFILQIIRDKYGDVICINSAYRSAAVNQHVGGVANSYHLQGRAADIRPSYYPSREYQDNLDRLIEVVNKYKPFFKEIIIYDTFIHVAI